MNSVGTIDLQIFLGRASDSSPSKDDGIPSLLMADTTRNQGRNTTTSQELELSQQSTAYIAIANSEVVEIVRFPFPINQIRPLVVNLTQNELTLQECVAWGAKLFDFVFHRSIRDTFRQMLSTEKQVRVTIATSVPELVFIPWELMCDTFPGLLPSFLCYNRQIHLIRSLRLYNRDEVEHKNLGDDNELRILLVTSSPKSQGYIDVIKEERMLRFVIDEAPEMSNVKLDVLHDANVNSLRERLLAFSPHIIHLSCHGGYDSEQGLGFVMLESAKNTETVDPVNSYRFAALIQEPKSVQLVFASTCQGAFQGTLSAFSGIAQCLHANGIPEVISLQFKLQDPTGHAIVLNFYKHLLRDGKSVEDSVAHVRRHLFINGYIFPESFGLAIYQGNGSFIWPGHVSASRIAGDSENGFNEIQDLFEAKFKKVVIERVSVEFEKISEALRDLGTLTTEDLLVMHSIFSDILLGLRIAREFNTSGIPTSNLLRILRLAQILSMQKYESKFLASAIVVMSHGDFDRYLNKHELQKNDQLKWNIYEASIKEIVATAIKASGENHALFAIIDNDGEVRVHVQELLPACKVDVKPVGIDPKWSRLCASISDGGCAFLLPGDVRLKVIVQGEQIAEFSSGSWRHANLKEIRDAFRNLAATELLVEELCLNIMRKCLIASEKRRGFSLILQRTKNVSLNPNYFDVNLQSDNMGLREKPIYEIEDQTYLDKVAGDNAVIISAKGITLAFNAVLTYLGSTNVEAIPGTGSRHLSAQKVTKETDAIAFVVSEDGPISIFQNGLRTQFFL